MAEKEKFIEDHVQPLLDRIAEKGGLITDAQLEAWRRSLPREPAKWLVSALAQQLVDDGVLAIDEDERGRSVYRMVEEIETETGSDSDDESEEEEEQSDEEQEEPVPSTPAPRLSRQAAAEQTDQRVLARLAQGPAQRGELIALGLPSSTVHRVLKRLISAGTIERTEQGYVLAQAPTGAPARARKQPRKQARKTAPAARPTARKKSPAPAPTERTLVQQIAALPAKELVQLVDQLAPLVAARRMAQSAQMDWAHALERLEQAQP